MCTCNERQKHIVATRRTADDVVIKLWSTGEITTNFGAIPKSVGKSPYGYVRAQAVRVNWLVDFALYDWRELSVVITAYRNELRKVGLLYSESDAVITAKRQVRKALSCAATPTPKTATRTRRATRDLLG